MTGSQPLPTIAELTCDRDGTVASGYDTTPEGLRETLSTAGWASEVATTETVRPYEDVCPQCCEYLEIVEGYVL